KSSSLLKSGIMTIFLPFTQAEGLFTVNVVIAEQAASINVPCGSDCDAVPLLILAVVGAKERLNEKSLLRFFPLLKLLMSDSAFSKVPLASPSVVTIDGNRNLPCAASPED